MLSLHQRPRQPAFTSRVTAKKVKRRLHYVDERNNAHSQTFVQCKSDVTDTPAETFRAAHLHKHFSI